MWTPEYYVRLLDIPPTVEGVTVPNDDGTFDVYLSRHLSPRRRRECLEHELRHIRRDHFYSSLPTSTLESDAGSPALVNVFDLPDPSSIPYFPSLSAFQTYIETLSLQLHRPNE